jgi:predicted lipase
MTETVIETNKFSLPTALDCCSASQKAYDEAAIQTDLMHALIIDQPLSTILAFRGTKEARDFLTDAEFEMIQITDVGIKVHNGFWKAWLSIKDQINDWVKSVPSYKSFYITGHSLGGAMANIACRNFAIQGITFSQCYTFGEPRSGNRKWARDCEDRFGRRKFRVVNNVDIVPRSPALFTGYRHTKTNIYVSEDGSLYHNPPFPVRIALDIMAMWYDFKNTQFGLLKDHAIEDYKIRLNKQQ